MSLFAILIFFWQFPLGFIITNSIDCENKLTSGERYTTSLILGAVANSYLTFCFLLLFGSWNMTIYCLWFVLTVSLFITIYKHFTFSALSVDSLLARKGQMNHPVVWIISVVLILYSVILLGGILLDQEGYPAVISLGWLILPTTWA